MGKFLLTDGYVAIISGGVTYDLSNYAHGLDTPSSKEKVDVSGFSSTASKEFLPGQRDDSAVLSMLQNFTGGTSGVHGVFWPLYYSGGTFQFDLRAVSPTTNSTVSATNPAYRGTAILYEYDGLNGQLNARGEVTLSLAPAPNTFFNWATS